MIKRHERIRGWAVGLLGNDATLMEARNSNPSGARERNRVSEIFTDSLRGILSLVMLTAFFCVYSNPVEFKQCVPASGSNISSFNFELEFDIEKALEAAAKDAPGVNVGIGFMGGAEATGTGGNATLYKGDENSQEILGTSLNANFTGKSEGFTVNGNKVKMIFDDAIHLIANQEYTIKITNVFYLYKENAATRVNSTRTDFHSNPIILKFTGADLGDSKIFVEGSNIENGSSLEKIENVEFNLSAPFTINPGAEVLIKEGDNVIARTSELKASPADEKILIADFGNNAVLYLGHNYTVVLPAGSVSLSSNSNATNLEYSVDVKGLSNFVIKLASSKVEKDDKGIPVSITFIYDLPEGTILSERTSFSEDAIGHMIYIGVNDRIRGSFIENGKGLKWTFKKDYWSPDTEYTFCKEANSIYVCDASGNYLPEYIKEVDEVSFTTPSFEAWGYPKFEFAPMVIANDGITDAAGEYKDGLKANYLGQLKISLKDKNYTLDGTRYYLAIHPKYGMGVSPKVNFYEITSNGDKLVHSQQLSIVSNQDDYDVWRVGNITPKIYLYEGKKYKLIIPKGMLTITPINGTSTSLSNLIINEEMVFTFEGTTPLKAVVKSCSLQENAEIHKLYNISWVFEGKYRLNDDIPSAIYQYTPDGKPAVAPIQKPAIVTVNGNQTTLFVDFVSKTTGEPTTFNNNRTITVTVPKGMLINEMNDEIVNDEIILTFRGVDTDTSGKIVNVKLDIDGLHTSTHPATEGKTYQFTLEPAENWKVESVMNGENEVRPIIGTNTYMLPALKGDTNLTAHFEYTGHWAKDETTGVWTIEDKNIRIYRDSDHIVVDGVTPENTICVYNVAGMLINSTRVSEGNDRVLISVPLGQTYIVTVDGIAAKIKM